MSFSTVFTSLMESRNLTAYKVSKATGIPQAMLGRWKSGKSAPSLEKVQILADYFKVSTDYLLEKTSDPTPIDIKSSPIDQLEPKEMLRQAMVKKGILPADRPMTDEEQNAILAFAETYFKRNDK